MPKRADKMIRVSLITKEALKNLKKPDESYDEVIRRLLKAVLIEGGYDEDGF